MEHILCQIASLWKGIFVLSIFGTKIHVLDPFLLKLLCVLIILLLDHFSCIDYKILPTVFQDIVQFREDIKCICKRIISLTFIPKYIKLGFGLGGFTKFQFFSQILICLVKFHLMHYLRTVCYVLPKE